MSELLEDMPSLDAEAMAKLTETVKQENIELLMDISKLCHRKDRRNVENILLIGMSGAGKSALVNTVIKAIAGTYIPRAHIGRGIVASKTLTLYRYEHCGVRSEDIESGLQQDLVTKMLEKLPTIIDMAGKGDNNNEEMLELLEVLIGGYIPPGTSIEDLQALQKEHGVGELKGSIYTKPNPAWKINKVVFVQGCHDAVPHNLIECLHTVLKKTDKVTKAPLYTQDIFVVITKYDMVTDSPLKGNSDKSYMSMKDFRAKEKEIAEQFNIVGALAHNRIRWVSYGDNVGYNNPHIDNIALRFLKRMVTPGNVEQKPPQAVMTFSTKLKLAIKRFMRNNNISPAAVFIFIFILVVAIMFTKFLANPL